MNSVDDTNNPAAVTRLPKDERKEIVRIRMLIVYNAVLTHIKDCFPSVQRRAKHARMHTTVRRVSL